MSPSSWLSRLRPSAGPDLQDAEVTAPTRPVVPRTIAERLDASLRRPEEALAPRALRRALSELRSVVDSRISEVEAGRRANAVAKWYAGREAAERRDIWLLMSEQFAPDAQRMQSAHSDF
ncbi:MAG: malonyl-CoA decarboxylase, partial [Comamonadaceae bacterium]